MAYLHGASGEIGESKVASVTQADVVAAYIGTAPVKDVYKRQSFPSGTETREPAKPPA